MVIQFYSNDNFKGLLHFHNTQDAVQMIHLIEKLTIIGCSSCNQIFGMPSGTKALYLRLETVDRPIKICSISSRLKRLSHPQIAPSLISTSHGIPSQLQALLATFSLPFPHESFTTTTSLPRYAHLVCIASVSSVSMRILTGKHDYNKTAATGILTLLRDCNALDKWMTWYRSSPTSYL